MLIELINIVLPDWNVEDKIDGITYRSATNEELETVKKLVSTESPVFNEYYDDSKKILIALDDDTIIGSSIINFSERNGIVGCIVVKKDYLGKRIGANMVAFGNRQLKKAGKQNSFVGYTDSMND